jgi:hypothetical protein
MVGLVAGSVIPDAPMMSAMPYGYGQAHSPMGVITVDLVAGIALTLVWTVLVRSFVLAASPVWVRERVAAPARWGRREWSLLPVAVILGAATHVLWDEFTHSGRWGATHIAWLSDDHLGYAGYHWAQAASSVLGLMIVVGVGLRTLAHRSRRPNPSPASGGGRWLALATVGVATVAAIVAGSVDLDRGTHAAAISAAEDGIAVLALAVVIAALLWRIANAARRPTVI